MFQRNKQALGKEKARKRKTEETKNNSVFEKGLMDKKQEK